MAVGRLPFGITLVSTAPVLQVLVETLATFFANFPTRYKHVITGHKSSKADDMLGGIIADGMGLGKTLTMIANIVASLSHADEFAASDTASGEPRTHLIPVKATLVIVPSVCELLFLPLVFLS